MVTKKPLHQKPRQSAQSRVIVKTPERSSLKALVRSALSRQERLVVMLHYADRLTDREVGRVLELSEASVRQTRARVLSRLRTHMAWRGMSGAVGSD